MKIKILSAILFVLALAGIYQNTPAQKKCSGTEIFTQKNCAGDEQTQQEKELYRLINEYRKQNNLPEVPVSDELNLVANRHVIDLNLNIKFLTHSWSDCEYKDSDLSTWKCVFDAPKRFYPAFNGIGFENVYYTFGETVSPVRALEAWKKSPLHNSLILNLNLFKDSKWNRCGVAIDGQYAALWFSSDGQNPFMSRRPQKPAGLGVSFKDAVKNLSSVLSINNVSSTIESNKWVGTSADKSVVLEIFGKPEEIYEGRLAISVKLDKGGNASENNKNLLRVFLNNLVSDWTQRDAWLEASLQKINKNPKSGQKTAHKNIAVEMSVNKDGFITLLINPRPVAVEVK